MGTFLSFQQLPTQFEVPPTHFLNFSLELVTSQLPVSASSQLSLVSVRNFQKILQELSGVGPMKFFICFDQFYKLAENDGLKNCFFTFFLKSVNPFQRMCLPQNFISLILSQKKRNSRILIFYSFYKLYFKAKIFSTYPKTNWLSHIFDFARKNI